MTKEEKPVGGKTVLEEFNEVIKKTEKEIEITDITKDLINMEKLTKVMLDLTDLFKKYRLNHFEMELVLNHYKMALGEIMAEKNEQALKMTKLITKFRDAQERDK